MPKIIQLLCILIIIPVGVTAQTLKEKIDAIVNNSLPGSSVGLSFIDASTNKIIYEKNSSKRLNPASNMKIFTAASALYGLGENYQYTTTVYKDSKNQQYYIKFTGDPSFSTNDLSTLLQNAFKETKVRSLKHNLVIDDSRFQPPYYPSGTSFDDIGWYYAPVASAVILDENKQQYLARTAKNLNQPIAIQDTGKDIGLHIVNNVKTVSHTESKHHCSLHVTPKEDNTIELYGCLAQREQPKLLQLAIPNPLLYAKTYIKSALRHQNIRLKADIVQGKVPNTATVIASISSKPLKDLIAHMLAESDNLYADSISKTLGYKMTGEGSYIQGAFASQTILAKHTKLDMNKIDYSDGIGTRYNLVAPRQITQLLQDIYQDKTIQPVMFDVLPKSGVSGTISDRMASEQMKERVMAKTGSMHDVSAISGYLLTPKNKVIAFSIITNNFIEHVSKARKMEDKILTTVMNHYLEEKTNDGESGKLQA